MDVTTLQLTGGASLTIEEPTEPNTHRLSDAGTIEPIPDDEREPAGEPHAHLDIDGQRHDLPLDVARALAAREITIDDAIEHAN